MCLTSAKPAISRVGNGGQPGPPIDRARKLHQSMRQINDPIQPGAEQILLPGLVSLPRPYRSPSLDHLKGKEKPICKKTAAPPPNSGKNHYLETLNHPSRSTPWKYFTGDCLTPSSGEEKRWSPTRSGFWRCTSSCRNLCQRRDG